MLGGSCAAAWGWQQPPQLLSPARTPCSLPFLSSQGEPTSDPEGHTARPCLQRGQPLPPALSIKPPDSWLAASLPSLSCLPTASRGHQWHHLAPCSPAPSCSPSTLGRLWGWDSAPRAHHSAGLAVLCWHGGCSPGRRAAGVGGHGHGVAWEGRALLTDTRGWRQTGGQCPGLGTGIVSGRCIWGCRGWACAVSALQHTDTAGHVPSPRHASSAHRQALHTEMVRNSKQKRRKPPGSAHSLPSSLSPGSCSAPAWAVVAPWYGTGSLGTAPGVPVPAPDVPVPAPGCGRSAGRPARTLGAAFPRHGEGK